MDEGDGDGSNLDRVKKKNLQRFRSRRYGTVVGQRTVNGTTDPGVKESRPTFVEISVG